MLYINSASTTIYNLTMRNCPLINGTCPSIKQIPNITEFINFNSIQFNYCLNLNIFYIIECPNTKHMIILLYDYEHTSIHTFHNSLQCSLSEEPLCDMQEFLPWRDLGGREGGANSSCTYDRLAIATCSLADVTLFNLSIPIQYQVWGCVYCTTYVHMHTQTSTHTNTHRQIPTCAHTFIHTYSSCSTSLTLIWEELKRHLTSVPSTL